MEMDQAAVAFEHAYFLVIRLDEFSSGLGMGLKAAEANQVPARAWVDIGSVPAGPEFITKLTPPRSSLAPPAPELGGEKLDYPADLLEAECHVVRIRKRTWHTPSPMISVGRAQEQDIPLQHPSVSKLHALFESEGSELHVTDVGSLNHTFVNGEVIKGRTKILPGDSIKFGAVRSGACTVQGLWRALRSAPASTPK
jgi:hypothetical protein